jgi:hypothetical protein
VGVLWITGGRMQDIPHRESAFTKTTLSAGSSGLILTIFVVRVAKMLVSTNLKNILTSLKTLLFKKDS